MITPKILKFRVKGEPRPKQSFKVALKNGKLFGYTPKLVKLWADLVSIEAKQVMIDREIYSGNLFVVLDFELSNKRRVDLDNLSKCVLDAMNGIVYKDDSEIMDLEIMKCVGKNPGVSITIKEL